MHCESEFRAIKECEVLDIAEKIVEKLGNAEQCTMTYSLVRNDVTHVRDYFWLLLHFFTLIMCALCCTMKCCDY